MGKLDNGYILEMTEKSHLRIVLDFYQSNNLKYVYLVENDYHYVCDEPKWGNRKIIRTGQMGDFIEFDPDESIASISEKYMELCKELGIINKKENTINKKPKELRQVLAKIGNADQDPKYCIIFYAEGGWKNYQFSKGEEVLEWKYVEDCF